MKVASAIVLSAFDFLLTPATAFAAEKPEFAMVPHGPERSTLPNSQMRYLFVLRMIVRALQFVFLI